MSKEEIQEQIDALEDAYYSCNDEDLERIDDIEYQIGTLYSKLSKLDNKKEEPTK